MYTQQYYFAHPWRNCFAQILYWGLLSLGLPFRSHLSARNVCSAGVCEHIKLWYEAENHCQLCSRLWIGRPIWFERVTNCNGFERVTN
jgi:hypothetical protein